MSTFAEHLPLKLSPSTVYFEQSFCKGAETIIGSKTVEATCQVFHLVHSKVITQML